RNDICLKFLQKSRKRGLTQPSITIGQSCAGYGVALCRGKSESLLKPGIEHQRVFGFTQFFDDRPLLDERFAEPTLTETRLMRHFGGNFVALQLDAAFAFLVEARAMGQLQQLGAHAGEARLALVPKLADDQIALFERQGAAGEVRKHNGELVDLLIKPEPLKQWMGLG